MWEFIQDQILGMKWLSSLIGRLLTAAGLDVNTRIGGSVQFFLYDVIKIGRMPRASPERRTEEYLVNSLHHN